MPTIGNLTDDALTILVARLQAPAHLIWILVSIPAIFSNAFLIVVTVRTPSLRTKSQMVVISLASAEISQLTFYLLTASKRILIYFLPWPEHPSQLGCLVQSLPVNICQAAVGNLILALSLDRCMAIVCPLAYRNLPMASYICVVNLITWGVAIFHGLLSFIQYNPHQILLICSFATCYNEAYMLSYDVVCHLRAGLTLLFQIITARIIWRRIGSLSRLSSINQRAEKKQLLELNTFKAVVFITVLYACSIWAGYLTFTILKSTNERLEIVLAPYVTVLLISNSASHFFVYMIMSRRFRGAFVALCSSGPVPV